MNFRSENDFNVVVNALSGNFLPLVEEKGKFNLAVTIYAIFTWIIEIAYVASWLFGSIKYDPLLRAFQEACVPAVSVVELIILTIYLNLRRKDLRNLINKFNAILIDSDHFKQCMRDCVEPNKKYLKVYSFAIVASTCWWAGAPIMKVLEKDRFTYRDYTLTAYLPGEPFEIGTFIGGIFLQIFGITILALKKIAIDVYISYFVTLLTSAYKYIREQLAAALHREHDSEKYEISVIADLQQCVQHHCAVIEAGQMLIEIMAAHVGLIYISSIIRFCLCGFSFLSFPDDSFKQFLFVCYASGTFVQIFMLCSCAHQLLEASTSITDDAFHENWHARGITVKSMFSMIELSNRMECRLSAYRTVDLVLPTLALIVNKAYSASLLLQKMN